MPMPFDPTLLAQIMVDPRVRQELAMNSHLMFFSIYLGHYMDFVMAPFQHEMFRITEDQSIKNALIMAFRNSAKSTVITMSYPLWSILGCQKKKFVVILSNTQLQAQQHMKNIRAELESNELLRADLGPFQEDDQWGAQGLILPKYGARIVALSIDQSIRGLRHLQHRPDLIICDDIENRDQMKTKEGRDKIENWFMSEVLPLGDLKTRIFMVGNLTHEDSLMMRLMTSVGAGTYAAKVLTCPFQDEDGKLAWPGKFPNLAAAEEYRKQSGMNEVSWRREMMLEIVPDEDQIIHPDWFGFYKDLPSFDDKSYRFSALCVDLAISQKDSADKTAVVVMHVFGSEDKLRIYIGPYPVNKRLQFHEIYGEIRDTAVSVNRLTSMRPKIYVEKVGFQESMAQELERMGYPAIGVPVHGDKRERLNCTTHLIKNKQVLFPETGAEDLITQLAFFGVERFDDLADAFSLGVNKVLSIHRYSYVLGVGSIDKWGNLDFDPIVIEGDEDEDEE